MAITTLVTVIIPCHNREEYLFECLESLAQQTYQYVQVIVVDDASTTSLETLVKDIKWPETYIVTFLRSNKNLGPGPTRNWGLEHAKGKYINFQDSDDIFHKEKLRKQVELLESNPSTAMCYGPTLYFESMPLTGKEKLRPNSTRVCKRILPSILDGRPWSTGVCLWRRSAIEGICFPDARTWEDYAFDIEVGTLDLPIIYHSEILFYKRQNHDSHQLSSRREIDIAIEKSKALEIIVETLLIHQKIDDVIARKLLKTIYRNFLQLLVGNQELVALHNMRLLNKCSTHAHYKVTAVLFLKCLYFLLPDALFKKAAFRLRRAF